LSGASGVIATGSLYNQGGTINPTIGVLDFTNVTIAAGATVTVTCANPLALLSRGSQSISGQILANGQAGQAASRGGQGGAGGPGGFAGGAGVPAGQHTGGSPGLGSGGGLTTFGGNYGFGAGGAYGGASAGGISSDPAYSGQVYGDLNSALLGGSGGSGGGGAFGDPGGGGGGGGAIELVAVNGVAIYNQSFQSTGLISANGGGGGPGDAPTGGGGSGGGIIIAAPTISFSGNQTSVEASGAGWDGGGGRILLLSNADGISVNGSTYTSSGLVGSVGIFTSTAPLVEGYSQGVTEVGQLNGFISPSVPEPSTCAMMLLGLLGLGACRRAAPTNA
jgi:hypothetical protein